MRDNKLALLAVGIGLVSITVGELYCVCKKINTRMIIRKRLKEMVAE